MANDNRDHLKLPEDLLIEIFIRSSVKSLLRAKCVCKQWYALIRNPNLVLSHLQYQKKQNKDRLLLQYFDVDIQRHSYALFAPESNTYHHIDHLHDRYALHMQGPINGLYCLYNYQDRIVLWNPALMESKTLPLPHYHFFPHVNVYDGCIGFGVDPSTQDCKLILIRRLEDEFDVIFKRYITVYNLTTNTWRLLNLPEFHQFEFEFNETLSSSFLNGSCHWLTSSGVIVAFDMAEEKFRMILGPVPLVPPSDLFPGYLTIHNNKVVLLHEVEHSIEKSVDLWVMLEEGIWIKQFSVNSLPTNLSMVGLWKNDTILFVMFENFEQNTKSQIFLCNANTQEMRVVGPKENPLNFQASVYYESLVSLDNRTQHKGKLTSLNTISNFFKRCQMPQEEFA